MMRRRGRAPLSTLVAWNVVLVGVSLGLGPVERSIRESRLAAEPVAAPPPPVERVAPRLERAPEPPPPPTTAPVVEDQAAEARARAAIDTVKEEVELAIVRERFDDALSLYATIDESARGTRAWRETAAPMIARLEGLKRAQGAYEALVSEVESLLDTGDVEQAKQLVASFPHKDTIYGERLRKKLDAALSAGAAVAARPRPEPAKDEPTPGGEPKKLDGAPPPPPNTPGVRGLMAGHSRLEGKTWAVESALPKATAVRVLAALETSGKLGQRLFGQKRKQGEPLPRAVVYKDFAELRAAELSPRDVSTTVRKDEEIEELVDRVVLLAAKKQVELGLGDPRRAPAWVVPGVTRFLATYTAGERGDVLYARRADAWRNAFLADPPKGDGKALHQLVSIAPGTALDEPQNVRAWGLAFFALASDDARQSPLQKKVVEYLRKIAADAQRKDAPQDVAHLKLLEDMSDKNAGAFEKFWAEYVEWGDVERPEIQEDAQGWLFVRFERWPVKVRTDVMDPDFARSVGFFFGNLFRGYDRFYQDRLGLQHKTLNECTCKIFKSTDEFQDWAKKRGFKILRPHYRPGDRETAMPCDDGRVGSIEPTLYHELGHRWNEVYFPMAPTWLEEGLATYLGGTRRELSRFEFGECSGFLSVARGQIENGTNDSLPTLLAMSYDEFHKEPREMIHYAEACSVVHWLLEENGESADPEATLRFFRAAPGGKATVAGLEAAFGKPIADLERRWKAHVKRR